MRRPLCLLATLALCGWLGCKDKDKDEGTKTQAAAPNLDPRCEQLAKTCGDADKHGAKLAENCKQAAKKQLDKVCGDKASALYDCYEKELCGKGDKVWTIDDLRVLAERHGKCAAEQAAVKACVGE